MLLKIEKITDPKVIQKEATPVSNNRPKNQLSILDLRLQPQKLSNWCWAAIAASLSQYYGTKGWQQEAISSHILGFNCSNFQQDKSIEAHCNQYAMLDQALKLVGCYSHWSPSRPSFERIKQEIDRGHPLCVRVEWYGGGFHYLVLMGYYHETKEIYVDDSLYGLSVQNFAEFPHNYRGIGGMWRETFWTCSAESTQ